MNQQNQANNSILSPDIPLKRKRGRPRKDQSQTPGKTTYVPRKKDQIQNPGDNASTPPGFEQANGDKPHPVATSNGNEDSMNMIGQMVTGVIEASFDAGFLISVRVGESETLLRGVVFKPGHYIPISAENDLAPHLQMIQRNEVAFPTQAQKRRGKPHGERHGSYPSNGSPSSSNQIARFRPKLPIVVAQSSHSVGSRGTLVPVVLQPVSLPNGASPIPEAPPIASQPAHLAAISKHKHAAPLTQTTQDAVPNKGSQTDSGSATQSFEELISFAKTMQGSPESLEARNESGISATSMLQKDSGLTPEQAEDLSKPLLVKPLQAVPSTRPEQSTPMSHTFPERRTGKMTELLLAVQENLMERQRAENQHQNIKNPEN